LRYAPAHFPATVLRTRAAGEFVCTETAYAPRAVLPPHAHEYACIVLIVDGTFAEPSGVYTAGATITRKPGEVHSDRVAHGGRCLNIELPPGVAPSRRATRHLYAAFHEDDSDLESMIRRVVSVAPEWLTAVRSHLTTHPDTRMTLEDLGDLAGVHPVHLASAFQRFYGMPVAAYQRRMRIEAACRALETTDASIADVALGAGFADQSHFGRALKRSLGLTPAQYRLKRVLSPKAAAK
jgi:AraC family transcriptional regulator